MTSLAAGSTSSVTIATQTTDSAEPFDLSAAESLYNDHLSAFCHGSWAITDSGLPTQHDDNDDGDDDDGGGLVVVVVDSDKKSQ